MRPIYAASVIATPRFGFAGRTTLPASFSAAAFSIAVRNPRFGVAYTLAETADANTISSLSSGVVTVSGLSGLTNPFATYTATPADTRLATLTQSVTVVVDPLPTITVKSPLDNAVSVVVTDNIVATFSAPIEFGTGNITLIKTGPTTVETFSVVTNVGTGNGTVSISGNVLTINPTASMAAATGHWINIDATAIVTSLSGAAFAGISDATTWNWTTA